MNKQILVSGPINSDKQPLLAGCCQILDSAGLPHHITELSTLFTGLSRYSTVIDFTANFLKERGLKIDPDKNIFINVTREGVAILEVSFAFFRECVNGIVRKLYLREGLRSCAGIRLASNGRGGCICISPHLNSPAAIVQYLDMSKPPLLDAPPTLALFSMHKGFLLPDTQFRLIYRWHSGNPTPWTCVTDTMSVVETPLANVSSKSESQRENDKSNYLQPAIYLRPSRVQRSPKELEDLVVKVKVSLQKAEAKFGQDKTKAGEKYSDKARAYLKNAHSVRTQLSESQVTKVRTKRMKQLMLYSALLDIKGDSDENACDVEIGKEEVFDSDKDSGKKREDSKHSEGDKSCVEDSAKSESSDDSEHSEGGKNRVEHSEQSASCKDSNHSAGGRRRVEDTEESESRVTDGRESPAPNKVDECGTPDNETKPECPQKEPDPVKDKDTTPSMNPDVQKAIAVIIQVMAMYGVRVVLLPPEHQGLSSPTLYRCSKFKGEPYLGAKCIVDLLRLRPRSANIVFLTPTENKFRFCWGGGFLKALRTSLDDDIAVLRARTTQSEEDWHFRYSLLEKSIPEIAREISLTAPFVISVAVSFDGCFLLCDHLKTEKESL